MSPPKSDQRRLSSKATRVPKTNRGPIARPKSKEEKRIRRVPLSGTGAASLCSCADGCRIDSAAAAPGRGCGAFEKGGRLCRENLAVQSVLKTDGCLAP